MKILHILDHYKPHFSGYVFRTSYILKHQRELGLNLALVTSPKQGAVVSDREYIDDMTVYRTSKTNFGATPFMREIKLMRSLQSRIEDAIRIERPDVIHAHSPSLNGMAALKAARRFGIPVVYEVRAFWEDAAVDHGTFKERSVKYQISRFLETRLFRQVDAVFTICAGLKSEIVSRGISEDKVTIIPNCVDTSVFFPSGYNAEVARKYLLDSRVVFGFIGSFYHYEGLDLIIDAFPEVLKKIKDARLLLVGDGPEKERLYEKAKRMGLLSSVIFTGKVPHSEVNSYYSVIDMLVYPRKKMRLTDLVTPLKPLEAMAMGKVIIGSDVGGIKELVTHNHDGFLFKADDQKALSDFLIEVGSRREALNSISTAAVETVKTRHKWRTAVERYLPVYKKITGMAT